MFQNTDLNYVFGPAVLIACIFLVASRIIRNKQTQTELNKAIGDFNITCGVFGLLLVILELSLPPFAGLTTFDYPEDVSAIKSEAKVLYLLQQHDKAIARMTEVLRWFLFLFVLSFLVTSFKVGKAYKKGEQKSFAQHAG